MARTHRQGTRITQTARRERLPQGQETRTITRDVGLATNVTASCTFVNGATKQIQAANGTFAAFNALALPFAIEVQGVNLNNGFFEVIAIDSVNQSFLTLDPGPKNEGPLTATVRTA